MKSQYTFGQIILRVLQVLQKIIMNY